LLIAIPVAIIGAISLSARRGIIIKDPAVLEKIDTCRTAVFDKTGTLTYGQPKLTELVPGAGFAGRDVLALVASLERYSKHPLAGAVLKAAQEGGWRFRTPPRSGSHPGRACAARSPGGPSGSPAASSWSHTSPDWRRSFLPPRAGWNAWS
jgi:cation transport ATPase